MAKVHQKFKRFKCKECFWSFKHNVSLEKHVTKMHLPMEILDIEQIKEEENFDMSNSGVYISQKKHGETNFTEVFSSAASECLAAK